MTLKTSLIITGDASTAQKAVEELKRGVEALGAGGKAAGGSFATLQAELGRAKGAIAALQTANAQLTGEFRQAQSAASTLTDELRKAQAASTALAGRVDVLETRLRASNKTHREGAVSMERHAFGARNLGQQFGDLGLSIAGGISPARAFGQQAGQMGYALSEMGGKAGAVGKFLTGPWGIALTIASAVLAPFVEELFKSGEAAKQAEAGAYALGDAQSALGQIFDLTSGKLKSQNELLILNARLTAINLRATALAKGQSARDAFSSAGDPSTASRVLGYATFAQNPAVGASLLAGNNQVRGLGEDARRANAIPDAGARTKALDALLQRAQGVDFRGSGVDKAAFSQAIIDSAASRANTAIADLIDHSLDDRRLAPGLRRDAGTGKSSKPKTAPSTPSTVARDEFGRDAADTIAGIAAQFDGTAPAVRQANTQVAKLNDLIDDLNRKKPPGFAQLIADARQAEGLIRNGLAKPYDDFIAAQQEGLAVQRLAAAGRLDEAEALRTIQGLQRQMGPLTDAQKDGVLATVQAMRAEAAAIDDLRARNAKYLEALGSIQGIVEDATQAFVRGDLGQFIKTPGKLLDAFQTLQGRKLFDKLFGGVFQDLADQVNGTAVVKDASQRMATAVDGVTRKSEQAATSFASLRPPIVDATKALAGFAGALRGATDAAGGSASAGLFDQGNGVTGPPDADEIARAINGDDIVVNGKRPKKDADAAFDPFSASIDKVFSKLGIKDPQLFGRSIGQNAGKAFGGAAEGALINSAIKPLANALGLKTSKMGAEIGGAVGAFVPIPFGKEIGAVVGSIVGGLFKKAKVGAADITVGKNGEFAAGATSGNNASAKSAASGLAGEVSGALNSIAQQLGGAVGSISGLSIGTKNGKIHVNAVGGQIGKKGSGDIGFGDDEAGAVAYAIQQAVAKGAVTGLSAAVQQAIRSSSDVDAALQEALKVQNVETLMGGVLAQYQKAFRDFEATAKERVRIAGEYGFDVVAIEQRNAADRLKIAEQLADAQVGGLKSLIEEMTTGNLFEGSALDKIAALGAAIGKAKADLDANVDGAGDRLAGLYQQRLAALKDAYGTTGAYAAGRDQTIGDAQAAIAKVNAQVVAAQAKSDAVKSDPALAMTNAALDENNDQNARIIDALDANNTLLAQALGGDGISLRGFDLSKLGSY